MRIILILAEKRKNELLTEKKIVNFDEIYLQ